MHYYLLDKRYRLCGWERLPYAVIDRKWAKASFIDREVFDALRLCNGQVDLSLPLISEGIRAKVRELEQEGIVKACKKGEALSPKQEYRLYPNRYMDTIHWSVTGRCNCRCRHCYMSAPDARYGELSHEQVMKIVQEMADCGVLSCSITGGEALVRRDFWDIIDGLLSEEIAIPTIYSNGFLVTESFLQGLSERGIKPEINMSFDGCGHHDWLRGIKGAEDAVRRAFKLCREYGFPTGAEMCLWKENASSMGETFHTLASLGCSHVKTGLIFPAGVWKDSGYAKEHTISDDSLLKLYLDYLDEFYENPPGIEVQLGGFFYADGRKLDRYSIPAVLSYASASNASICIHARNTMYISAEGRALPCMALSSMDEFIKDYPLVQEAGISKCLTDSKYMELIDMRAREIFRHNEKCRDCVYQKFCMGGCRAGAMRYHENDFLAVDEIICRIFREGWLDRIFEKVSKHNPKAICREKELLLEAGLLK